MSWQIPTLIEADIKSGKAQYRTFQTGNGGQSILPVPPNSYVVIFGYDFSPAGGGLGRISEPYDFTTEATVLSSVVIRWFETQQISFYTGTDFYPFIHHINSRITAVQNVVNASAPDAEQTLTVRAFQEIDTTPIARQVYITSTNDVTVTHGLVLVSDAATQNAIPVTNRTPLGLTYGGSGQVINTQTNFGPGATPLQFMQPSPKDYEDFAFGLLPNNADGQAFATPNVANGLRDVTQFLNSISPSYRDAAACNYYLNLHYALYTETVPDNRG